MSAVVTSTLLSGCNDGTCPAIFKTSDPDVVGVRGLEVSPADSAAVQRAPGETIVFLPRAVLDEYAAKQR